MNLFTELVHKYDMGIAGLQEVHNPFLAKTKKLDSSPKKERFFSVNYPKNGGAALGSRGRVWYNGGNATREEGAALEEKKTRRQQAEETKRHIFDAALALLDRRGFEEIKVRDIVEAAQVSVGTFYNYYATKLDVFYETYQLADEYFEESVAPRLVQSSARERLLLFFDEYARYSSEITDISLTKILYNSNNKCFDRSSAQGIRRVLREQVAYGLDRGELHGAGSAEEAAEFLLIAARGLVYHWCINDGAYSLRAAMARYMTRLLEAYR